MLSAIIAIGRVKEAYAQAVRGRYLWHEFGDSHLILRGAGAGQAVAS
jgi:S-adenosylmethionine:tRNA ribosyltransferase-isomerase